MPAKKGNISTLTNIGGYDIAYTIKSFVLSNAHTGSINVTVYIVDDDAIATAITALDYTLQNGQAYIRDIPIRVMPNWTIQIDTTDSLDYYFSIE